MSKNDETQFHITLDTVEYLFEINDWTFENKMIPMKTAIVP